MRVLVTRPEPDASETAARLGALELDPVIVPLTRFTVLDGALPDPAGFTAMALSSANALRALDARGALPVWRDRRVYAVGARTAAAAREAGFAEIVVAGGDFAALVEAIAAGTAAQRIFYPAARERTGDLRRSVAGRGIDVVTSEIYGMDAVTALPAALLGELGNGGIGAALFYSKRAADIFVALTAGRLDRHAHAHLGMLCLSEAVAAPLLDAHFVRIGLAADASDAAMMELALTFARERDA